MKLWTTKSNNWYMSWQRWFAWYPVYVPEPPFPAEHYRVSSGYQPISDPDIDKRYYHLVWLTWVECRVNLDYSNPRYFYRKPVDE